MKCFRNFLRKTYRTGQAATQQLQGFKYILVLLHLFLTFICFTKCFFTGLSAEKLLTE